MSLIPAFKIGIWNAWIFMSVFIVQMLAIAFINKSSWERSHVSKEARRNMLERYIGIIANFIWLLTLIYSIFLPFRLGTIWFYVGFLVFIIGFILMTIATYDFITTPPDQLITKGLYRFSRHPLYLSTFFICVGSGIATASWLFIFFSLILVFCLHQEALVEERYCLDKYGSAYQEYINSVPRWFGVKNRLW